MRAGIMVALAALAATAGATGRPPRSLVARMQDAREGFTAPAKEMRWEEEAAADAADWPFDVARIERMLERGLVRDAEGGYRLRRAPEGEKGTTAALAYVNDVVSEWAVMQLDAKFPRADAAVVRHLAAYRTDRDAGFWDRFVVVAEKGALFGAKGGNGGWVAAWRIAGCLHLLVVADLADACRVRDYQFVMWDGTKDWPVAGFDEFPDAARARTVLRLVKSPSAANNLAALLHAREANRRLQMPEYMETLLRRAAAGGSEAAFHNLGVLMEERGDREQAAAFYSREKARTED